MSDRSVLPVVEGHGDVEATPILIRRILVAEGRSDIRVAKPFRIKRQQIIRPGELERSLQVAMTDRPDTSAVVILIDADDDCPAELGASLLMRAKSVLQVPASVVCAKSEFESWFLGSKRSLRGKRGIRADAEDIADSESIRGAKERLSRNMIDGRTYLAVDDQPAFAAEFDLEVARRNCSSFDKLVRDLLMLTMNM